MGDRKDIGIVLSTCTHINHIRVTAARQKSVCVRVSNFESESAGIGIGNSEQQQQRHNVVDTKHADMWKVKVNSEP
ncbi:hypothetical protein ACLKA6_004744 [Drosophila palustris]